MKLTPEQKIMLNVFTGPGGTEAGFRHAGYYSRDAIEFDKDACQTIQYNYPDIVIHNKDIRDLLVSELRFRYYLIHLYTWPCKKYSKIADIKKTRTGDDLYLQALRLQALLWPEVIFVENVEGMKEGFPVVMETWRTLPGYQCHEFTIHGHEFSLMRKSRVILILTRQTFTFPTIPEFIEQYGIGADFPALLRTPERTLADYLQSPDDMDEACLDDVKMYPYIEKRLAKGYKRPPRVYLPTRNEPIHLPIGAGHDRSNYMVVDPSTGKERPFSHREFARLHTFSDTHQFFGKKNARFTQVVDSVMPIVAYIFAKMLDLYFDAIEAPMPQLQSLGHRMMSSESHSGSDVMYSIPLFS
jgi:DNA (cytosine-5)-methyltransferase 1